MKKSKLFKDILFVVAIIALFGLVWNIGPAVIFANIERTGWWFFPIIGIWVIVYLLNAKAFHLVICDNEHKNSISYWRSLQLTISGFALNYSTPAGMMGGMPYRVVVLKEVVGMKKATSSVVLYTMMHISAHFIFWLTSILLIALFIPVAMGLKMALLTIFLFFSALIFLFFRGYKKGVLLQFFSLLKKQPFFKKKAVHFYNSKLNDLQEIDIQISDLYLNRRQTFYQVLVIEFVGRMVNCLEVFFIISAVGVSVTYMQAFVAVAMTTLLANVLFFFPMQVGPREIGYSGALSLLKLVPIVGTVGALGIYVSLVTRIREFFWIGLGIVLMKLKA